MRLRGLDVQTGDAAAGDAAHCQDGVEHPGRVVVGRVAGPSRDLQDAVPPREGLADAGTVPDVRRGLGEGDLRHGG